MAYSESSDYKDKLKNKLHNIASHLLMAIVLVAIVALLGWCAIYLPGLSEVDRDPQRSILQSYEPISGYEQVDKWIVETKELPDSKAKNDFLNSIGDALDDGKLNGNEFRVLTKKHQTLINFQGIAKVKEVLGKSGDGDAK